MHSPLWLSKSADVSFLIRISISGIVTSVSAFIARLSTETILKSGLGTEGNPFFYVLGPIHSSVQSSGLMIGIGAAVIYPMLFLWGQSRPKFKKWAEVIAIVGMLIVFFDMVNDVLIVLMNVRY